MTSKKRNRKRFWITWRTGAQQITERFSTRERAAVRAVAVVLRIKRPVTLGRDRVAHVTLAA